MMGYHYRFTENVYKSSDKTFAALKQLRENKDIVILNGDKDSSVVIMNKLDYTNKINNMINEGILKGTYVETNDNTLKDLKSFQSFLYRHFRDHPKYKDMRPASNQPARLFATAKTHKFDNFANITK